MSGEEWQIGRTFVWALGPKGEIHTSTIERACPVCGAQAIVALPASMREQYPDVEFICHPWPGGCNLGFRADRSPLVEP